MHLHNHSQKSADLDKILLIEPVGAGKCLSEFPGVDCAFSLERKFGNDDSRTSELAAVLRSSKIISALIPAFSIKK